MAKYTVLRTDTADSQLRRIILGIAENFGNQVALTKIDEIEKDMLILEDNPYIGVDPRYMVLRRQKYKVLVLEKNLVFYKIDESKKEVMVYAIVDQRQDYVSIVNGL